MSEIFPQFLVDVPLWNEGYGVFGVHQSYLDAISHVLLNVLPEEQLAGLEVEFSSRDLNYATWETAGDEPVRDHSFEVIRPTLKYPLRRLAVVEFVPVHDIKDNPEYYRLVTETLRVCSWGDSDCPISDHLASLARVSTHVGIWEECL